jgi:hypothetical protein
VLAGARDYRHIGSQAQDLPQPLGTEYPVTSCDLGVFEEETAEPVSSDDLDVGIDGIG